MKVETRVWLIGVAYAGFVVLGLSSALLGVAWPSIRGSFGLSLDAVGSLMIAGTVGYLLSSFVSGPAISRIGVGPFLAISSLIAGVSLLGCAWAPAWWVLVLIGFVRGIGGGAIDAGLNTYFATNHSASLMNWLHASFGLGAALGPAIVTAVLGAGWSWRWSYVFAGAAQMLFAVLFGGTRSHWRLAGTEADQSSPGASTDRVRGGATLRLPVVWFGIAMFVMFTGIEGTAGQWPYTLFTEARSIAPATAGLWMSVYWASLTLGRIVFGIVGDRFRITSAVRACMLGITLGSALLAWNAFDLLGFLGLALIGFWLGPLFPLEISDTPRRVGNAHAPNAIGFQVAAASLGIAALPGLAGVLAESIGLEIIGPFLLVASIVMVLLHEMIVHRTRAARRVS